MIIFMNRFTIYIYCDLVKMLDHTHNREENKEQDTEYNKKIY